MGDARLTRQARLSRRVQFNRVFAQAHRQADRFFTVLFRSNNDGLPRLGMAVSARLDKRATRRNRLKRVIRESFRYHQCELADYDIVVIPRPAACTADTRQLRASLATHWHRSKRITP